MEHWYTRPEWWLAGIAVLTLLAICWQAREMTRATREMRETTKATEKAAQAALLNAKAVIASERPWIVVTLIKTTIGAFGYRVANNGRTPAQIESIFYSFGFDSYRDKNRVPPNYTSKIYPPQNLLESNGGFDLYEKKHPQTVVEGAGLQDRVAKGNQFLIYDGKITYWDALSEGKERVLHETVWCYYFDFATRTFIRIEEFNRHT
jgi:hypothetical protein